MDLQTLTQLFSTTYNPDPNVRKAAELQIRKVGNQEGMIAAILRIIAADTIDISTRQACAVWLKNRLHTYALEEARRPDQAVIAPSEREALRINILPLLAASPNRSLSLQLANGLKSIVAHDFPEKWPGLVDEVKRLLLSSNVNDVHAGCVAALEVIRAFRFRYQNDVLPTIVAALFPTLVQIASGMIQQPPSASQEIPTMLHLILKTYRTSIVTVLSPHQQSPESLVPWGQLLFAVVNLNLPKEAVPEDLEEREKSPWWKAKKWAYAVLARLFHRYGNPSQLPTALKEAYLDFAQHFVSSFAPEILNTYLRRVELYISGQEWLSNKCQYLIFQFFTECVKPKSTWILLKPHFDTLVSKFVFPQLSFTEARRQLWENDPIDYVRVSVDEYESYTTPVSAATTFLYALAVNRTKITFMPILSFINTILANPATPPEQRFGVLNMTAALGPYIMRHPEVKQSVEHLLTNFVTKELSASEPYLRAIAIEIVGTMTKQGFQWSTPQLLREHFEAVARSLDDPEFPVKVQAALALTEMVQAYESVREAVAPQIGKVIQDLLKMSDETDLDILNNSMDVMVELFQTELLPVAAQLAARLCESYMRLARESAIHEHLEENADLDALLTDGDDDKVFAAMGVAKTISTIIASIDSSPEILAQIQEIVIPIITFTLENRLLDLFDNMYELVDSLTYKLKAISPSMWPVFEMTYRLFKHEAVDFLEEMLPSLDNFVSYGGDVIKSHHDYKQMLVDIYTTSMTNEHLGENDMVNGSKLAESILLNLRGAVDDYLQPIIQTALNSNDKINTRALRLANLEVLINAVLYNPSASLQIMESHKLGTARAFFDKWFTFITTESRLPRVHDKKLSVLALCALLEVPAEVVPESLKAGWPGIVGGILKIFKGLPKAIEERKRLEQLLQEEEEDSDSDEERLNLAENDEDVWDDESRYREIIAAEGNRLREEALKARELGSQADSDGEDIDGDDDDDEEDDRIEEELGYISPLDNVNPYAVFKQALTGYQLQNPMGYQAATTALDVEHQTILMEVMKLAEQEQGAPQS
ncbi:armadillo-type protein [Panaeolus papilionaceus]|nr:armadillo-type protein [Panaeolus papilionaceus]